MFQMINETFLALSTSTVRKALVAEQVPKF